MPRSCLRLILFGLIIRIFKDWSDDAFRCAVDGANCNQSELKEFFRENCNISPIYINKLVSSPLSGFSNIRLTILRVILLGTKIARMEISAMNLRFSLYCKLKTASKCKLSSSIYAINSGSNLDDLERAVAFDKTLHGLPRSHQVRLWWSQFA